MSLGGLEDRGTKKEETSFSWLLCTTLLLSDFFQWACTYFLMRRRLGSNKVLFLFLVSLKWVDTFHGLVFTEGETQNTSISWSFYFFLIFCTIYFFLSFCLLLTYSKGYITKDFSNYLILPTVLRKDYQCELLQANLISDLHIPPLHHTFKISMYISLVGFITVHLRVIRNGDNYGIIQP